MKLFIVLFVTFLYLLLAISVVTNFKNIATSYSQELEKTLTQAAN